jgi:hypothetical protein
LSYIVLNFYLVHCPFVCLIKYDVSLYALAVTV